MIQLTLRNNIFGFGLLIGIFILGMTSDLEVANHSDVGNQKPIQSGYPYKPNQNIFRHLANPRYSNDQTKEFITDEVKNRSPTSYPEVALINNQSLNISCDPFSTQDEVFEKHGYFGGGQPQIVMVDGEYAFLGLDRRVLIFNIQDMSNPILLGESPLFGGAVYDIESSGTLIYVVDSKENFAYTPTSDGDLLTSDVGLHILDITDPANPVEIGFHPTLNSRNLSLQNNIIYTVDNSVGAPGGLRIIDVGDPTTPVQIGLYEIPYINELSDLVVNGSLVYLTWSTNLPSTNTLPSFQVIDVSNPSSPQLIGFNDETTFSSPKLALTGDYAYVVSNAGGLYIYDISNPHLPDQINSLNGRYYGIAFHSNYAYLAKAIYGYQILDITNPGAPVNIVTPLISPIMPYDLVVDGQNLFMADIGKGGLQIFSLGNPAIPTQAGGIDLALAPADLHISGSTLFFLERYGFHIFDISDSRDPIEIGSTGAGGGYKMVSEGNYLYVNNFDGLHILDVSDPSTPNEVGYLNIPGGTGLAVRNDYVYTSADGLSIISVSDPSNPQLIGNFQTPGGVVDILIEGGLAFLAEVPYGDPFGEQQGGGIRILNISNPANPTEVGFYDSPGSPRSIALAGNTLYLADAYGGFQIINIINPANPILSYIVDSIEIIIGGVSARNEVFIAQQVSLHEEFLYIGYVSRTCGGTVVNYIDRGQFYFTIGQEPIFGRNYIFPGEDIYVSSDLIYILSQSIGESSISMEYLPITIGNSQ